MTHRDPRRATVLLLVLWMLIVLGVIGISYSASVHSQLRGAGARTGRAEAYWAARAGIEKARAVLRLADLQMLELTNPLLSSEEDFARQPVGRAEFSLVAPQPRAGGAPVHGLVDEASRLNVNVATEETLFKLPTITYEMMHGLIDWRDQDDLPQPMGAEKDYYQSLDDPYFPANQGLGSVRELMRVRGWEELWESAWPNPYERYRTERGPAAFDAEEARELLGWLTVWSLDRRPAPDGEERMDLNQASADTMRQRITGLSEEQAKAIVASREKEEFKTPLGLLEVTEPEKKDDKQEGEKKDEKDNKKKRDDASRQRAQAMAARGGRGGRGPQGQAQPGGGRRQGQGKKVFDWKRVAEIIDYFSVKDEIDQGAPGLVNLNTAPFDVLAALPGMDETRAQQIVQQREAKPIERPGEIAALNGMNEENFKKLYANATTTSSRFHVYSHGRSLQFGARATIEAVLSVEDDDVMVVYWREY